MKAWITFFSQTGSEILNISRKLGVLPDFVVTNQSDIEKINHDLLNVLSPSQLLILPDKPTAEEYETAIEECIRFTLADADDVIVTLHGWLRIIPASICEKYNIINGHPGLITKYPELKGKDPQKRSVDYETQGCVLHKVTRGVDEGEVIASGAITLPFEKRTLDNITFNLRILMEDLWINLLRNQYNLGTTK